MASIDTYLQQILAAIYGEDVRGAIHDAIQEINDVVQNWESGLMDTTLTSTTLPAQGKAVGDVVNKIKNDLSYSALDSFVTSSIFSSQLLPDVMASQTPLNGVLTSGSAWNVSGTPTSGGNYCYTRYTIQASYRKSFLIVTGHSWGEQWPLIVFYNSSDKIVAIYGALSSQSYDHEIVCIPDQASYAIVNGDQRSGSYQEPVAVLWSKQTTTDNVFADLKAFDTIINSSYIDSNPSYALLSNWKNNFVYAVASNAYPKITDAPKGFTSYGTLIKFTPHINRTTKVYSCYILANDKHVWIGYELSNSLVWKEITTGKNESCNIQCGLDYITPDSENVGKAKSISGSEGSSSNYQYNMYTITPGIRLLVSGCNYYSSSFPLYIFYDSNDQVVETSDSNLQNNQLCFKLPVIAPNTAVKMAVNGAINPTGNYCEPCLQIYNNDVALSDVYDFIKKRKYLFIGDSYCEGYSHDGRNDGWALYCAGYMGLTSSDYVRSYSGGASFSSNSSNNTFIAQLNNLQYPYDYFTDIVVCGGYNDNSYTEDQITAGISDFIAKAKKKFPKARIHVGFIAWNKQGNGSGAIEGWQAINQDLTGIVLPTYQKCVNFGAEYLNNVEYWLNDAGLTPSDGYHPSETGNRNIGRAVANALLSGSAPLPYNSALRLS